MGIFDKGIRSYPAAPKYTWAGTFDLQVILADGKVWLLDIKTGKVVNLKNYPNGYDSWRWQLAPYRQASKSDKHGVIHLATDEEQFHFFDLTDIGGKDTYQEDLDFFLALRSAWYKHPDKIKKLEKGHVPSVTEITGLLGFAPGGWTAVNAMRDKMYEFHGKNNFEGRTISSETFTSWVEEARKWGGRGRSAAAMATGKQIHEVIERWIKNGVEPSNSEPDKVVRAYLNFREWHDENVIEVLATEKVIYG